MLTALHIARNIVLHRHFSTFTSLRNFTRKFQFKMPPKFTKDTSKTSSTDGGSPVKEENFVDALLSQVDEDNVDDIIKIQKKALERFEKTNEMLITCVALSEKRLERAKTEFVENKKLLVNAKSDLEIVFRKLRNMKQLLATKYPDIYGQIAEQNKPPAEEE